MAVTSSGHGIMRWPACLKTCPETNPSPLNWLSQRRPLVSFRDADINTFRNWRKFWMICWFHCDVCVFTFCNIVSLLTDRNARAKVKRCQTWQRQQDRHREGDSETSLKGPSYCRGGGKTSCVLQASNSEFDKGSRELTNYRFLFLFIAF